MKLLSQSSLVLLLTLFAFSNRAVATGEEVGEEVALHSVVIGGDEIVVTYSKNFPTCAHLKDASGRLVHQQNHFCPSGQNVQRSVPRDAFTSTLVIGDKLRLCHGNNGNICSSFVSAGAAMPANDCVRAFAVRGITGDWHENGYFEGWVKYKHATKNQHMFLVQMRGSYHYTVASVVGKTSARFGYCGKAYTDPINCSRHWRNRRGRLDQDSKFVSCGT